jgi:lysophospholipase L1-like esterase|tara:strand:- start:12036 stop:12698 length:663 start_codon:yes stop_codon:yes gene_type:complete
MSGRIVCIGDSITEGIGDEDAHGWVGRVGQLLAHEAASKQAEPWRMINLGVAGDTSIDIKHRLCSEVFYRTPQLLIIAAGINDTAYKIWPDKRGHKIDLHMARFTWKESFSILKGAAYPIILVGPTPVNESKLPGVWRPFDDRDKGTDLHNADIIAYNEMLKSEAALAGHGFVDMFSALEHNKFIATLADGLHPNNKGYDMMAEIMSTYLRQMDLQQYAL